MALWSSGHAGLDSASLCMTQISTRSTENLDSEEHGVRHDFLCEMRLWIEIIVNWL